MSINVGGCDCHNLNGQRVNFRVDKFNFFVNFAHGGFADNEDIFTVTILNLRQDRLNVDKSHYNS